MAMAKSLTRLFVLYLLIKRVIYRFLFFQGLTGERGFKGDGGMKGECMFLNQLYKKKIKHIIRHFSWYPWP